MKWDNHHQYTLNTLIPCGGVGMPSAYVYRLPFPPAQTGTREQQVLYCVRIRLGGDTKPGLEDADFYHLVSCQDVTDRYFLQDVWSLGS